MAFGYGDNVTGMGGEGIIGICIFVRVARVIGFVMLWEVG